MTDNPRVGGEWLVCDRCGRHFHASEVHDCPAPRMTAPTTRERVARALNNAVNLCPWERLPDWERRKFLSQADAALSALQPQPKGWEVSGKSLGAFNAAHDSAGGNLLNRRMCAMRAAVPHLLRDLADGVSADALMDAWRKVNEAPYDGALLRRFLRALADQEEGKPHA